MFAPETDLTQLAYQCGYFDQAHFNKEFKAFAGMTPSEYVHQMRGLQGRSGAKMSCFYNRSLRRACKNGASELGLSNRTRRHCHEADFLAKPARPGPRRGHRLLHTQARLLRGGGRALWTKALVTLRLPDDEVLTIALNLAESDGDLALVGKQAGFHPLFGVVTDDCLGDYRRMKDAGVTFHGEPQVQPYGTGVLLEDLYGNKIYLNQEPAEGDNDHPA